MKKILAITFCIWLSVLWAATIQVSAGDGTLSTAVAAADPNDILELAAGTYTEAAEIILEKNLTIRGASGTTPANVIIDGGGTHRVFKIMSSAVTINNLTIQNGLISSLPRGGGGIYVYGDIYVSCNLYMENCIVSGNRVNLGPGGARGGGVYIAYYSTYIGHNNIFIGNRAGSFGGGVYSGGEYTGNNNIFSGNTASNSGGGVYSEGIYTGNNNIFSGNIASVSGGGIYNAWGTYIGNNNIFSGNTASNSGGGVYSEGTYTGDYNCFHANTAPADPDIFGIVTGGTANNVLADPLLTSDLRLSEGSPAIDAGDDTVNVGTLDLAGNPRRSGAHIDMGPYEFQVAGGGGGSITEYVYSAVSDEVTYKRQTLAEVEICRIVMSKALTGLALAENDVSGNIIMGKTKEGKPYLNLDSGHSLASTLNAAGGAAWVTASFVVDSLQPIMLNGGQISDDQGNVFPAYTGYVSNISYANGEMTFRIFHFSEWSIPELQGKTYTGTLDTDSIVANGGSIEASAGAYLTNGGIGQNSNIGVAKISGLAYGTVLCDVPGAGSDLYKPMIPSRNDYSLHFGYINRGNNSDEFKIAASMVSENAGHFAYAIVTATKNIAEWQVVSFSIDVSNNAAKAFERATLSATVSIEGATAVSYNAYSGAYSTTFGDDGVYGGTEGMTYIFNFETEGYTLKVTNRVATINAPLGGGAFVPGAKVKYDIVVLNESSAEATDIIVKDVIPPNCHLFYSDIPTVNGAVTWNWMGAQDNNATSNTTDAVKYKITIPAYGNVTASYTVTLD